MDLGFGRKNGAVGNAAANALLQVSQAQEQVLEQEISKYDSLLDDDKALESLRRKRLEQMKKEQQNRIQWKAQGHGYYSELGQGQDTRDVARAFFEASKQSDRLVVHFYRNTSQHLCDVFHSHLEKLAPKHMETKFLKINVEGCDASTGNRGSGGGASYLVEKLGIVVMPTIVVVKNRKVVHHIRGFDELGGTDTFSTESLAFLLGQYEGLTLTDDEENAVPDEGDNHGVNRIHLRKGGTAREDRRQNRSLQEMEDF